MSAPPHAEAGRGVFETMLVLAGRPIELEAHLERIGASLATLYGATPPRDLRERALAHARPLATGRLRFTVEPSEGGVVATFETSAIDPAIVFPAAERAVRLRHTAVVGGLGEHKWADRRLLERAEGRFPGELPLLVDADGDVLEAARGSVFAVREGGLLTPPADGRILLSIARRQTIEAAVEAGVEVEEGRLTRGDLLRADGVFVAGSLRGLEPAGAIDGQALPGPGQITRRVAAGLRRRWGLAPAEEPAAAAAGGRPGDPPGR